MDDNQLSLNQQIEQLKAENHALKESMMADGSIGFEFIFNTVKQPIFLLKQQSNQQADIVEVNASACELVKYSANEIKTMSPVDLGLFDSVESFNKNQAILSRNEQISFLSKIKSKDGNTISSEITLYAFPAKNEKYFLVFQRNIGSQQKVVEALRHSEYRFLQMAENVLEGIIIVEENNRVFINSSICKITGYTKEELRDMDDLAIARKDEVDRLKAFKEKIAEYTQGIHGLEYWIITKDGHEKCIRTNYSFSIKASGKKSTYIITSDITVKKRVEEALRKSQSDFRMLAENSPDWITRYSRDLKYVFVNSTIEKVTGIPSAKCVGKNNLELELEPDLVSFLEDMHLEVFRTGRTVKFEFRIQKGQHPRIFQAHMVPELSMNGVVESVLNVARDITQIKKVERTLKEEKENVIIENELIGKHLLIWCNILCEQNKASIDAQNCLQPVMRIAQWAQHGHRIQEYTPRPMVINTELKEFYNNIAERVQAKGLESSLFLPVPNISIFSSKELVIQTLDLLLDNAIEATTHGKIEIGFDIYNENEVVFYVKDTGMGIEPENTEKIFEPYISIHKTNHAGLGLSIAKKNVDKFEGTLWCLSSPGTGSTFCFTHPAQIEKSLIQSINENDQAKWRNKTIIVVEDNDSNYLLLESILKIYKPKLLWAKNGEDGLKLIKDTPDVKLILMDIQLPGMNGYEVTRQVRTFNTVVPIIAQTAYAMYNDVVKALDSGCSDFIAKPIKRKKLLELVGGYLDEPEGII